MELIDKANILSDLVASYRLDEQWQEYFMVNDIGPFLSVYVSMGLIQQLSAFGEAFIEESYNSLLIVADREVDDYYYDSLDRLLGIDRAGVEFDDLKWENA